MPPRLISLLGLFTMVLLAWSMSSHKRKVSLRLVVGGMALQLVFAVLVLKTAPGQQLFLWLGEFFNHVLGYVDQGASFLFDVHPQEGDPAFPPAFLLLRSFAFGVLPTIVFFSSLMAILYHLGVMQKVVELFARVMQRVLGTSGAESLSAAANIFVGQTEAPLVIRPYIASMTLSELNAVMVGGFATIAGGVLAAYVRMGISAGHLITASVISAPAALMIAKVMQPETEQPRTLGHVKLDVERDTVNVIEATAAGATQGLSLALNVGAMLLVFVALIALLNGIVGWFGGLFGFTEASAWTLQKGLGWVFSPLAWLMGIPWAEARLAGQLLGIKTVVNEFVAFAELGRILSDSPSSLTGATAVHLSERSVVILTYAMAGFANFSSIGIQLGGIGGIAPERRADLARLGLRAMIGGTLAAFMTACVAGLLI
ncbi:MAG: NupC/NupG family nucleoside CNT transporter [Thermoanaerobaculia bacterium]